MWVSTHSLILLGFNWWGITHRHNLTMNLSVFPFIQKTPLYKNSIFVFTSSPPMLKSQRPTACSVLQDIVSSIVNLTFPNLHLRVMACLLDSKHKQRIMNIAKLFQNHSANFQNKGGQKQTNSLRKIHTRCACIKRYGEPSYQVCMYGNGMVNPLGSGVHVWKWHGEPSQIRCASMKMAWWTLSD